LDRIESKLAELGLALPEVREYTVANIVNTVRSGDLLFVSGHVPFGDGKLMRQGKLGADLTVDEGYELAKHVALGALASVKVELGSLDRVRRVVKLLGFVNSAPDFGEQPKVVNGASDLLIQLYGEAGRPARSAVGVAALPNQAPVEIEMVLEIGPEPRSREPRARQAASRHPLRDTEPMQASVARRGTASGRS
jgi:enamine deaminase RidA (YjgF/YER057c/UK114 family)